MRRIPVLTEFFVFSVLAALFVLFASLAIQPAMALDTVTRTVCPVRSWSAADLERFDPGWLQVKFIEGSDVRLEEGRFTADTGPLPDGVKELLAQDQVLELERTFDGDREALRALKARGEARSGVVGPDLSLWFNLRVIGGRGAVAEMVNALNACPEVEIAHPVPIPETAVLHGKRADQRWPANAAISASSTPGQTGQRRTANLGGTPDFTDQQEYLYDPPVGLDGPAAWDLPGGRGAGMKFIDVEGGWVFDHEDYNYDNYFFHGGEPNYPTDHGTAVMGEVVGSHNDYGIHGFAPDVQFGGETVSFDPWPDVSEYFQEAIDNLDAGDVWLIELQMYPPGQSATPMEWVQANYDVIWSGVFGRGVVCVEAGANGSQDLDAAVWEGVFDRNVRDSGAIMVGAGTPTGLTAEWFTNYGSRMDVNAWGSQIVTTGYGDLYNGGSLQEEYTADFGGTSGASPMVVGASLCLQGIARANLGSPLDPITLRSLLHDTGTPHEDPVKEIGPRPDLGAAIEALGELSDPVMLAGPGPAYDNLPVVRIFPPEQDAAHLQEFSAYGSPHYGVNVSCGHLIPGGADVILTGAGPGEVFGPHVRGFTYDGASVTPLPGLSFFAYGTPRYGVNVTAGDLNGDGLDEIITGAGPGAVFGPHVRAFSYDGSTVTPLPTVSFFAYGTLRWGVNVAAGDIDGDGYDEIVTGAGPGPVFGAHVRGFNVDGGSAAAMPDVSWFAYGTPRYGVVVSCGDMDGDGIAELVTAPGSSAQFPAQVRGWDYDGASVTQLPGFNFVAWPEQSRFGARVWAGTDLNADGRGDLLVAAGPDPMAGTPVKAYQYDGSEVTELFSLGAFDDTWTHGATVAAGRF